MTGNNQCKYTYSSDEQISSFSSNYHINRNYSVPNFVEPIIEFISSFYNYIHKKLCQWISLHQ